jgi:hypothetical protein
MVTHAWQTVVHFIIVVYRKTSERHFRDSAEGRFKRVIRMGNHSFGKTELGKWKWNHWFLIKHMYTLNSILTYVYVKGMHRSGSNLVMVWWFDRVRPIKNEKFSVSVHYPQQLYTFNSNSKYGYALGTCRSSSNTFSRNPKLRAFPLLKVQYSTNRRSIGQRKKFSRVKYNSLFVTV